MLATKEDQSTGSTSQGSQVRILYRPVQPSPPAQVVGGEGVLPASLPPLVASEVARGESNAEYHACNRTVSKSGFWCFHSQGPAAFRDRYVDRVAHPEQSASLSHGTLLHSWLETGDEFWQGVVAPPSGTVTATGRLGKDAYAWHAETCPDLTLVSPAELAQLRLEVEALQSDPAVADILAGREDAEVSCRFNVEDFPCRCRPDLISNGRVVDLKTTKETNLSRSWWRAVMNYGYHMQDALYQTGAEACLGLEPRPLIFLVVSTQPPHEVMVCTLPPRLCAVGHTALSQTIAEVRLRLDTACWLPNHSGEITELEIPSHVYGGAF